MEAIELIELISRGEDSRTQFKRDINNAASLAGEFVAFSNSKGGRILVGVDDDGTIVGLSPDDIRRINLLLSSTATDSVRPSITVSSENIKTAAGPLVMVVTVREGVSKPYSDNTGVFWMKSGADKRRVVAREEIQRLLQGVELIHADEVPVEGSTVADLDHAHFNTFFEKNYGLELAVALERDAISLPQLLRNFGLAEKDSLNLAGLMLFGQRPQRHRPAFVVKAVSFVGNEASGDKYRDSEDIAGCLRDLYRATMSFLTRNLRRVQGDKSINSEGDLELPISALEEIVVNMLLHRDYFMSAPWRVFIFENRVEFMSPGALPNNLTVENIRSGVSLIRNPIIASFGTKELPYRGIGTGIRRAVAAIPDLNLQSDPERNLFTVTVPRSPRG